MSSKIPSCSSFYKFDHVTSVLLNACKSSRGVIVYVIFIRFLSSRGKKARRNHASTPKRNTLVELSAVAEPVALIRFRGMIGAMVIDLRAASAPLVRNMRMGVKT